MIYKTEKKYWANGFYKRFNFWIYAFNIKNIGIMICKPFCKNEIISIYKLI